MELPTFKLVPPDDETRKHLLPCHLLPSMHKADLNYVWKANKLTALVVCDRCLYVLELC